MESLDLVLVTDNYPPFVGGGPLMQWELARGLALRGHAVDVVTSRLQGTPREEWSDGVHVRRTGQGRPGGRYWFAANALPTVRRVARRADALQACTFIGAAPGGIGAKMAGCPAVLTVYEVFGDDWPTYVTNRALARTLQAAEKALLGLPFTAHAAISEYTAERMRRWSKGKLKPTVVYPGIDETFWKPDPSARERFRAANGLGSRFTYLFYGRAGYSKGVLTLLDSAERFAEEQPEARLVMILNPGEVGAAAIERIQSSAALRGHVILHRGLPRAAVRDAVLGADCVVVPSLAEGFGFTAVEPCHVGIPVLATEVGALREVVGGPHRFVTPGDPMALLEGLRAAAVGDWDVTPLRRFSWQDTIAAYERLLRTAASSQP